jgi:hypothetical protein
MANLHSNLTFSALSAKIVPKFPPLWILEYASHDCTYLELCRLHRKRSVIHIRHSQKRWPVRQSQWNENAWISPLLLPKTPLPVSLETPRNL